MNTFPLTLTGQLAEKPGYSIEEMPFEAYRGANGEPVRGIEYQVRDNDRICSVVSLEDGLWDVAAPGQLKPLYTGRDGKQAAMACATYLTGGV